MSKRTDQERDRRILRLSKAYFAFGHEGMNERDRIEIEENLKWLVDEVNARRQAKVDKLQKKLF